jgi:hypothetical protein
MGKRETHKTADSSLSAGPPGWHSRTHAEVSFQMLANMARRETEKAVLAKTLRWFVSSVCEEEKVRIREMSGRGRDERGCREGMQKRSERIVYGCLVGRRKACSG